MSDSHQRPTLKTISEMTGFAVATVSRALKDAPDISESTKIRVREVADEIGYRPNRAGVRLRTGKTNVVALILPMDENVMNHTAQLIYSISKTLKGTPYHMIVLPFSSSEDPMTPVRYLVETGAADGIILNQIKPEDPRVDYLLSIGFPFAAHGRTNWTGEHISFDFDNAAFAEQAVEALVQKGRKHILALAPPDLQSYGQHFRHGFQRGLSRFGVEGRILEDVTSDSTAAEVKAAFEAPLALGADGVVFAAASGAMAGTVALERRGLVLGRDFDVVAKEAVAILELFRNEMIVVREDVSAAGRFLAEALIDLIEGRPDATRTALVKPSPFLVM